MNTQYRIVSTSLINAPGMLNYIQHVYRDDPQTGLRMMAAFAPQLPLSLALAVVEQDDDLHEHSVMITRSDDEESVLITDLTQLEN